PSPGRGARSLLSEAKEEAHAAGGVARGRDQAGGTAARRSPERAKPTFSQPRSRRAKSPERSEGGGARRGRRSERKGPGGRHGRPPPSRASEADVNPRPGRGARSLPSEAREEARAAGGVARGRDQAGGTAARRSPERAKPTFSSGPVRRARFRS